MQWSKLKKTIEEQFADSIRGRVQIYTTRYTIGSHFMARGWITIDGEEIANFSNPDHYAKFGWNDPDIDKRIPVNERNQNVDVEKGEFSRWDFTSSCFEFINMNINDAYESTNPIILAFAILDKRVGKRRLLKFDSSQSHPLVVRMLKLRIESEGIFHKTLNS
jgi:hypothetical protein